MATEPIGFFPSLPTKRDLELEAAKAKQNQQRTDAATLAVWFFGLLSLCLVVLLFMQMRRIPLAA
jgi:hypothetical protein